MPLTSKGSEIMKNMKSEYGDKRGESVFYASKNAKRISGVESRRHQRVRENLLKKFAEKLAKQNRKR